jgi:hypothetical protein
MYGKIIFKDEEALARFLKEFVGSTAIFSVKSYDGKEYELEFKGGY